MDSLVVDNKETAMECIRYLRDQRIGTLAFIPLDNISPQQPSDKYRSLDQRFKVCADLIEAEDVIRPAVLFAVGSAVVCESLDDARELCFTKNEKVKAVTLSGQVISRSGTMTGGSIGLERTNRWEEKELTELRTKKAQLEEALARLKQSSDRADLVALEAARKETEVRHRYSVADAEVTSKRLKQISQQIDLKRKARSKLAKDVANARQETEALQIKLGALRDSFAQIENRIFSGFCQSIGVGSIKEYEDGHYKQHQDLIKTISDLREQRVSLQAQISYEQKRDFNGAASRVQEEMSQVLREIQEVERVTGELMEQEEAVREEIREMEHRVKTLRESKKAEAERVKGITAQLTVSATALEGLQKSISSSELLLERDRAHLHDVLQAALVEEISLPTIPMPAASSEHPPSSDISSASKSDISLRWEGSRRASDSDEHSDG